MAFLIMQRAVQALCLMVLIGCSAPSTRQWEIDEILTQSPCFNGGRLVLGPDSDCSYLELELIRNSSGIRFYVNLLFLQAPPLKDNPEQTSLSINFEGQDPWIVHPYLLEGGQRLLLPGDIADRLVQAIIDEECFTILIGRNQITVISNQFVKNYKRLLDLPIEEFL